MIRYLLSHGADPHDSCALKAATEQDPKVLELLLHEHAIRYPKGRVGWATAVLLKAIESDDFCLFKKLLDRDTGAILVLKPSGPTLEPKVTPFGHAIRRGGGTGFKFVEHMLQQKFRTNCHPETTVSIDGVGFKARKLVKTTAFSAAIGTQSRPIVELMLRHHADVNFPAKYGVKRTPLQRATELGNRELIELLLDHGADVNNPAVQRGGGTALQLAALKGYIPIAQLLLEKGAKVDAPASKVDGRTALEGAAWGGRLDMVAMLLQAGAAHKGNDQGQLKRAIAFAEENIHSAVVDLLNSYTPNRPLNHGYPTICEEFFDFDSACA